MVTQVSHRISRLRVGDVPVRDIVDLANQIAQW
jgi:hypothetical protein